MREIERETQRKSRPHSSRIHFFFIFFFLPVFLVAFASLYSPFPCLTPRPNGSSSSRRHYHINPRRPGRLPAPKGTRREGETAGHWNCLLDLFRKLKRRPNEMQTKASNHPPATWRMRAQVESGERKLEDALIASYTSTSSSSTSFTVGSGGCASVGR